MSQNHLDLYDVNDTEKCFLLKRATYHYHTKKKINAPTVGLLQKKKKKQAKELKSPDVNCGRFSSVKSISL